MNWNDSIIEQFRANDGKVDRFGKHLLLLHTTGAKSGEPRIAPMMYFEEPEGIFVIASKAGAPDNPAWYHNLLAHPDIDLQAGTETFPVHARELEGEEREQWWERCVAAYPPYAEYQTKTDRLIPVFVLERR